MERGLAPSKPCPPAVHFNREEKATLLMIVLGADMHKSSHTLVTHVVRGRVPRP